MLKILILVSLWLSSGLAFGAEPFASSGSNRVHLVELYSSESCSSCPPADQWVSKLKTKDGLWTRFIPLVFHVDYWNNLGWKDGFSSDLMTRRQQELSQTWTKPSVYTPGFVVDGGEWRNWSSSALTNETKASAITLKIFKKDKVNFEVVAEGLDSKNNAMYNIRMAKLGMGLETHVSSGENSGRTLNHDFLVLDWITKMASAKENKISFTFKSGDKSATKTAVAVWIEKVGSPIPLQATGGYL